MISVSLKAQDGKGVKYDAVLDSYLNDFVSAGYPYMETDDQIVILAEFAGADTKIFVLDGSDMGYDLATHTVSGSLDKITIGTLGGSYNAGDDSFDVDANDHITGYDQIVTYDGVKASNGSSTKGDFHELVAELMYLGGVGAGGTPTFLETIEKGGQNVTGTNFKDVFTGTDAGDRIKGYGGNDVLKGAGGNDTLIGDNGNDTLKGGGGKDHIIGGNGNDVLFGGGGIDTVSGGKDNDLLKGNGGNDFLYGDAGNDTLKGGGGKDWLSGGAGNDQLFGDAGKDTLNGGNGNDLLDGGAGADLLQGGAGVDILRGGKGSDVLQGGAGNDVLEGGAGRDFLTGGAGKDTFLFSATSDANRDKITDFAHQDTISLVRIDADETRAGNQAFDFIGSDGFSGEAGELRYREKGGNTLVLGDTDGDGKADFTIKLADFSGVVESDFIL